MARLPTGSRLQTGFIIFEIMPHNPLILSTKNYLQVAAIEIILIFAVLTLGDIIQFSNPETSSKFISSILLGLEAVYIFLLLQLSAFLNPNKKAKLILRFAFGAIIVLSLICLNPFYEFVSNKTPWLISVHIILCSIECYLIALGLRDIYDDDLQITERLWGSVAIYLLIALGWASFFEIFVLINPKTLGVTLLPGYQTYSESLYYSLCSISGTSSVYTNPSHLVRNLALLEAVWGVLFLVMLIGRLFSLPSKPAR